jgi:hypothetical protein
MRKEKKSRRKSPAAASDEAPPELIEALELNPSLHRAGLSNDPDDYVWRGDDLGFDSHEWMGKHLGPGGPLAPVLLAIIRANPLEGASDRKRLQLAMKALVGHRSAGRPAEDWPLLLEIGREFFQDHVLKQHRPKAQLVRLAAAKVERDIQSLADESDFIKRTWRAFENNKDAVLFEVTGVASEEQKARKSSLAIILRELEWLGVKVRAAEKPRGKIR